MELGRGRDLTGVQGRCSGLGNSVNVREEHSPGVRWFSFKPGFLSLVPNGGGSIGGAGSEKKGFYSCMVLLGRGQEGSPAEVVS